MSVSTGNLLNKDAFVKDGIYNTELSEGLIVAYDKDHGGYNIGLLLGEDKVVVVDQVSKENINERLMFWKPQSAGLLDRKQITGKKSFMGQDQYNKGHYEGFIISSDKEPGYCKIAIELDKENVLVVDKARNSDLNNKIRTWIPLVESIQREYHSID